MGLVFFPSFLCFDLTCVEGKQPSPCPRQPPARDSELAVLPRSLTALCPGTAVIPGRAPVKGAFHQPRGEERGGLGWDALSKDTPLSRNCCAVSGSFSG